MWVNALDLNKIQQKWFLFVLQQYYYVWRIFLFLGEPITFNYKYLWKYI